MRVSRFWGAVQLAWLVAFGRPALRLRTSRDSGDDASLSALRERASTLWAAAVPLTQLRGQLAAYFAGRALREAARAGHAAIYGQAMSFFMFAITFWYGRRSKLVERRMETALTLVRRYGDPVDIGFVQVMRAACYLYLAEPARTCEITLPIATSTDAGAGIGASARSLARAISLPALYWVGRVRDLAAYAELWIEQSNTAGDRFLQAGFRLVSAHRFLRIDDSARAFAEIELARSRRLDDELADLADPWWEVGIALYAGQPERALEVCRSLRESFEGHSGISKTHRVLFAFSEASALAACAAEGRNEDEALRAIARAERLARSSGVMLGTAQAPQLAATAAWLRNDGKRARELLERALVEYEACGMRLFSASVRLRLARIGAADADGLRRAGLAVFEEEGIVEPERWANMLVPGFERTT
jgi:hypothetical protein